MSDTLELQKLVMNYKSVQLQKHHACVQNPYIITQEKADATTLDHRATRGVQTPWNRGRQISCRPNKYNFFSA